MRKEFRKLPFYNHHSGNLVKNHHHPVHIYISCLSQPNIFTHLFIPTIHTTVLILLHHYHYQQLVKFKISLKSLFLENVTLKIYNQNTVLKSDLNNFPNVCFLSIWYKFRFFFFRWNSIYFSILIDFIFGNVNHWHSLKFKTKSKGMFRRDPYPIYLVPNYPCR